MRYHFPMILPAVVDRVITMFGCLWYRLRTLLLSWIWGVDCGKGVRFEGPIYLRTYKRGVVKIGEGTVFNSWSRTNLVGLINPTILETRLGGVIRVGKKSGFSSVVISSKTSVDIGDNVLVGGNVRIFDHDFHSLNAEIRRSKDDRKNVRTAPVVIGNDCFIGTNAIILKGTEIGARSIVAAGSVVFGLKVPPDSLVKGNPAQIVSVKK